MLELDGFHQSQLGIAFVFEQKCNSPKICNLKILTTALITLSSAVSAFLSEEEPTAPVFPFSNILPYILPHGPQWGHRILSNYSRIAHLMLFAQERGTTYLDSLVLYFLLSVWINLDFHHPLAILPSFTLIFDLKAGCGTDSWPPDYTS